MDIIERIEKYRVAKGWSQYKLAAEAGLSQSVLSNMYARGTLPSLSTYVTFVKRWTYLYLPFSLTIAPVHPCRTKR
ncbi:MAG: helix-turn-helix transcriptional regulator [Clostridia bacterium]|nr:helix-turn-helix transcriptional regulator [Clostridia bacterium]